MPDAVLPPEARGEREALYQRLIMERARTPLHAGQLEPADGAADGNNPFCGDRTHVTLTLGADRRLAAVRHRTRGCALCTASADLMAESVAGLEAGEARALFGRFNTMLQQGATPRDGEAPGGLGLLVAFEGLHEFRSRRRCATLPWDALLDALGPAPAGEAPLGQPGEGDARRGDDRTRDDRTG